jgi:CheY-like chemotaxis protein
MTTTAAKKVLVIDEEEDHLMICKLVLEHRGYDVLGLSGFEQANQLFETVYSFRPHVIFIDEQSPGVNGQEVIGMLKQVPEFSQIPVIGILRLEGQESLGPMEGTDGHLTKPLKIADLLSILAKYTGSDLA